MFESIQKSLSGVFSSPKSESFTNHENGQVIHLAPSTPAELIATLLTLFLYFAIIAAIGMYLWNKCAVKLVSIAKPATSMWQVLGLLILTQLLFN
tara:strand:+ start:253 stop:537 length:285 start_codon:yes stop_codon:yes gene_type:complete